jgi:PAS domain S-box-containing protein
VHRQELMPLTTQLGPLLSPSLATTPDCVAKRAPTHHGQLPFRALLFRLTAAVLLPTLGMGILATYVAASRQRIAAEQRLRDTAHALAIAVDAEIGAHVRALQTLASNPVLDAGANTDLRAADMLLQRASAAIGLPIALIAPSGRELVHTGVPQGVQVPPTRQTDALQRVIKTARPVVLDLLRSVFARRYVTGAMVPVVRNGRTVAVLAIRIEPDRLRRLLASEEAGLDSVAMLVDSQGTLVARSDALSERLVGLRLPPKNAARLSASAAGLFTGTALDGSRYVYGFHSLTAAPGWTVSVARHPATLVVEGLRPLLLLASGGVLALLLGAVLGTSVARRVLLPLRLLTAHAARVAAAGGEGPRDRVTADVLPSAPVAELEILRRGFAAAERALHQRADAEREASRAAASRDAQLRALFEVSAAGIVLSDIAGRIFEANDAFLRMVGLQRADLSSGLVRWDELTPPEWLALDEAAIAEAIAAPDGRCRPYKKEYRHSDGMRVPVLITFALVDRVEWKAVALVIDLTEARRQEEELRDLLATLDLGAFITHDVDGTIRHWSAGCERLYGWNSAEAVGRSTHELVQTRWPVPLADIEKELERQGEWEGDLLHRTRGGRELVIRSRKILRRNSEGRAVVLEAVTDVTALRRAEEAAARNAAELERLVKERTHALRKSEARLAQAAKMEALGRLAGGIAHDFNNVLQAVQGALALAGKYARTDTHRAERYVKMASDAAERGVVVTGRLLTFAHRGKLVAKPVNLAPLLNSLSQMLRHTVDPSVTLEVRVDDDLPLVLADPGQLETVLVNLTNNARDALAVQDGTVRLTAEVSADADRRPAQLREGRFIRISVSDNGVGMSPEVLERVTEPFFTTKAKGKGTGLGLAMARGFAEQSGGALTIDSALGAGTTVSLWLPATSAQAAGSPEQGATKPSRDAAFQGHAVMVVDDEPIVREVFTASLSGHGHAVTSAEGGHAALRLMDDGVEPEVLVTDLSMPGGMDGLALIREARSRKPGLPAILITGQVGEAGDASLKEVARTGPFEVLRKPVLPEFLEARVAALLETASGA